MRAECRELRIEWEGADARCSQARYFKTMLREADHLDRVRRLRVQEADVAPLKPAYEVRSAGLLPL